MVAKKKSPPKKPPEPKINPHLMGYGYSADSLARNKGNFKKAKADHQKMGKKLQELTGEKNHDKIRHFMGSQPHGRLVGYYKDKPAALRVLWGRFCNGGYDPIKFCEGKETVGNKPIEEGKRLRRLGKAVAGELGLHVPRYERHYDTPGGRLKRLGLTVAHTGAQAGVGALAGGVLGGPAGAAIGAAGMGIAGFAAQVRSRYKTLKSSNEDTQPFINALAEDLEISPEEALALCEGKRLRRLGKALDKWDPDGGKSLMHGGAMMAAGVFSNPVVAAGVTAGVAGHAAYKIGKEYRKLKKMGEDVEPFLQGLIDQGYPQEEIDQLITEEWAMTEHATNILQAIVDEKPHNTKEALHDALTDKLEAKLDDYKAYLAQAIFNPQVGDPEDYDDDEDDDEDEKEDDDGKVEPLQCDDNEQVKEGLRDFQNDARYVDKPGPVLRLAGQHIKRGVKKAFGREEPRFSAAARAEKEADLRKEDVEHVTELSADTYRSYGAKATKNLVTAALARGALKQQVAEKRGSGKRVYYNTKKRKAEAAAQEAAISKRTKGLTTQDRLMRKKTPRGPGKRPH